MKEQQWHWSGNNTNSFHAWGPCYDGPHGKNLKAKILEEIPAVKLDVMELDLSSLASVEKFASEYKSLGLPLNVLMDYGYPISAVQRQLRNLACNQPFRLLMKATEKEGLSMFIQRPHGFAYSEGIRFGSINDES
ncbi:Short-chain dehydrogenase TIC 32 chloroplastic, partial [Bienertia sinuspersici]